MSDIQKIIDNSPKGDIKYINSMYKKIVDYIGNDMKNLKYLTKEDISDIVLGNSSFSLSVFYRNKRILLKLINEFSFDESIIEQIENLDYKALFYYKCKAYFYKDFDSVIKNIDIHSDNYSKEQIAKIKFVTLLLWHGYLFNQIPEIKILDLKNEIKNENEIQIINEFLSMYENPSSVLLNGANINMFMSRFNQNLDKRIEANVLRRNKKLVILNEELPKRHNDMAMNDILKNTSIIKDDIVEIFTLEPGFKNKNSTNVLELLIQYSVWYECFFK